MHTWVPKECGWPPADEAPLLLWAPCSDPPVLTLQVPGTWKHQMQPWWWSDETCDGRTDRAWECFELEDFEPPGFEGFVELRVPAEEVTVPRKWDLPFLNGCAHHCLWSAGLLDRRDHGGMPPMMDKALGQECPHLLTLHSPEMSPHIAVRMCLAAWGCRWWG